MSGLKQKILAADDRPFEDVDVEEWDMPVRVRGLSGHGAEEFSRRMRSEDDELPKGIMAELLVRTLEDPATSEPIFGPDDVEALSAKSSRVIARLFRVAQKLSGLGGLDDAKKDSEATQTSGSPSA